MQVNTSIRTALAASLILALGAAAADEAKPKITSGPTVQRDGGAATIRFAVSVATDVEVAILDEKGKVVRHLAAGRLGPNAPAPLLKDSLKQELVWDGKNDRGETVAGASKVRVRVGVKSRLDRYVGWDGRTVDQNIVGVTVDDSGDIYVLSTEQSWGRTLLTVFDKEGAYKRTVIPFPAKTPKARRKAFGTHTMADGTEVPFVFNAHNGCTQFMISALRDQDVVLHPDGHVLLTSANGSLSNHGPAQHLLAVHPEGGMPEKLEYVGPMVRKVKGFMGGAGNRDADVYNGLALSPDGKHIYQARFSSSYVYKKTRPHGVFRLQWSDKATGEPFLGKLKPGKDDAHFKNPMGLATDKDGNIYVCDHGNNRLMVFSPEAKLLKKVEITTPYQVKVHPVSGVVYVLSRATSKPVKLKRSSILKYSSLADGMKKLAEHPAPAKRNFKHLALDHTAKPPRLIVAQLMGWRVSDKLFLLTDKGSSFEAGARINNRRGLSYPLFTAVDSTRDKVYVNSFMCGMDSVDLKTGKVKRLGIRANEVAVRDNGDIYAGSGWGWVMNRYDGEGKRLPLKDANGKGSIGPWKMGMSGKRQNVARMKGRGQGGRGFAFGPDGNLYILKMSQYGNGCVDVYSPEGKLLKEKVVENVPHGSGGIGVDASGNIYIGGNLRPMEGTDFYPKGFSDAPTDRWIWYKSKRPAPWNRVYFNTYLFHYGGIMKFPPSGGKFYIWKPKGRKATPKPANMPDGVPVYRSGYLSQHIAVKGMTSYTLGCSPVPTSGENWGDPSCTCWNPRIKVDAYGRIYAPDALRFSVNVFDAEGNLITRMGRYGNADDKGPDIFFAWPAYVDAASDKLYVTDSNANRMAVVGLTYAAEASAGL